MKSRKSQTRAQLEPTPQISRSPLSFFLSLLLSLALARSLLSFWPLANAQRKQIILSTVRRKCNDLFLNDKNNRNSNNNNNKHPRHTHTHTSSKKNNKKNSIIFFFSPDIHIIVAAPLGCCVHARARCLLHFHRSQRCCMQKYHICNLSAFYEFQTNENEASANKAETTS